MISLSVYLFVCLSMSISLELLDRSSRNLLCRSLWPWLGNQSSSGSVAIRDVLLVSWMMSRLAVVGCMAMRGDTGVKCDAYECLVGMCNHFVVPFELN